MNSGNGIFFTPMHKAGFTYRPNKLKTRASEKMGASEKNEGLYHEQQRLFFGLHRYLSANTTSANIKTIFLWSSSISSGKNRNSSGPLRV